MRFLTLRRLLPALLLLPLLALSACSDSTPPAPVPAPKPASLYDRMGGQPAINALVEDFAANVTTDKRVSAIFRKANMTNLKAKMGDTLCAAAGGPCTPAAKPAAAAGKAPRLTDAQFNAVVEDLQKSMTKANLSDADQATLLAPVTAMRADYVVRKAAPAPAPKKKTTTN